MFYNEKNNIPLKKHECYKLYVKLEHYLKAENKGSEAGNSNPYTSDH